MAVLPTTLMAFGNLASENEITAMRANGISLYRMILPGAIVASFLTVGMILYNNHVLPESNHKLLNLLIDINKKKPTVEIKENVFISAFKDHTIYVRHKNDKTGEIREVQIFRYSETGALPTTIVAEKGKLKYLEDSNVLRFELENGEIHEMPQNNDPSTYRRTAFKNYIINIKDVDRSLKRSERSYRGDREMSVKQMNDKIEEFRGEIQTIDDKMAALATSQSRSILGLLNSENRDSLLGAGREESDTRGSTSEAPGMRVRVRGVPSRQGPPAPITKTSVTRKTLESQREIKESYFRQIDRYRVEIHKKFSIPFACVIFVLIGSPMAIRVGRSGMNMAIGLSILVFLVYYVCLIGGEKLADRQIVSPVFAMWVPNIIFGCAALLLIRKASMEQSEIMWSRYNPLKLLRRAS